MRVGWVDGEVGGACFEDAEQGDNEVRGRVESDGDGVFWANADGEEMVSELVGALVELMEGERGGIGDNGCAGWELIGQGLEPVVDAGPFGKRGFGVIPVDEEQLAFGGGQKR